MAALVPLIVAGSTWAEPARATNAGAAEPAPAPHRAAQSTTVTLLTGDVITLSTLPNGHRSFRVVRTADRGPGVPVAFTGFEDGEDFYVIPTDVEPYLASDKLDRELFNVAALAGDLPGAPSLPLIITYEEDHGGLVARQSLPGGKTWRPLPSVDGGALSMAPGQMASFWEAVDDDSVSIAATATGEGPPELSGGIEKIWLDRPVQATLAESVPQIGTPTAWAAGIDGTGVTVAVLDTGVDAEHPDLSGKVTAAANFTGDPTADDGHGHGTHVASIIASTGAAENGRYRGVAPGADLLSAKVLDASGFGLSSWVIAGLDWAAQHGAQVVNMSLALNAPTDGTDPLGRAVDQITTTTGTLVVAAAGNRSQPYTVYSPAAAAEALAVGAVDKGGAMAWFSSRGPGLNTGAVKPEITAPGMGIVAARASGTSLGPPVGDHYTQLDGTSMAAPHVAGAAALLAQENPTWQAPELKDTLVSTAGSGGHRWFEEGAGLVDVERALMQEIHGTAVLNFGRFEYPHEGSDPVTRELTYHNAGDQAVTLELAIDVKGWAGAAPAPDGAVSLDSTAVTIAPGASSSVRATVDPTIGPMSVYGGIITATSSDRSVEVRTPLSWYKEPPAGDLVVHVNDARGRPVPNGALRVTRGDDPDPNIPYGDRFFLVPIVDGVATARLPQGVYQVHEFVFDVTLGMRRLSILADSEVRVPDELAVHLDGRTAVPIRPTAPEHVQQLETIFGLTRSRAPSGAQTDEVSALSPGNIEIYWTPAGLVETGWVSQFDRWSLESSLLDIRILGHADLKLHPDYAPFQSAPKLAALSGRFPVVFAGQGRPEDFAARDVDGKLALVRLHVPSGGDELDRIAEAHRLAGLATAHAAAAGARAIFIYVDEPGAIPLLNLTGDPIAQLALSNDEGEALRRLTGRSHPLSLALTGRDSPERVYRVQFDHPGGITADYRKQIDPDDLAQIDSRYHADKPGLVYIEEWDTFSERHPASATPNRYVRAPTEWTELIGELGDELTWRRRVSQSTGQFDPSPTQLTDVAVFPEGQRRSTERWFDSPIQMGTAETRPSVPFLVDFCTPCREGNIIVPPEYEVDAGQRHSTFLWGGRPGSTAQLFHEETEIPVDLSQGYPRFRVPAEPGEYRMDLRSQQRAPELRTLGTIVNTSWRFTSSTPEQGHMPDHYACRVSFVGRTCEFLPLLLLRYDLELDLLNQAVAGRATSFTVTAAAPQDVPDRPLATGMQVWTSTDDGSTWRPAVVSPRSDGTFAVTVVHPRLAATNGFVSLRVDAWDDSGNRVSQTVEHAYALTDTPAG